MQNLVEAMEVAEIESKDITAADFSDLEDEKWDGLEDKSRQLYDILCMLTLGRFEKYLEEMESLRGKRLPRAMLEGLWRGC